ncbi:MAG: tetratricopeptide repeat protein [Myxococcota bacterium]
MIRVRVILLATLVASLTVSWSLPRQAQAQDWSVEGGEDRRREIINRYKRLLEKKPVEGLIFKKLLSYVGGTRGVDRLIADYEKAAEKDPDNEAYQLILGHLYKEQSDYEKALAAYDKAVELAPKDSNAWLSRGSVRMLLQQDKEAKQDFEKALSLEDNRDRKEKILRKLADVAFSQRDWEAAEGYYDRLIELDPRNEYLRMEYAQVLVKYKRFEKALEQYDELIKLAGRDTKARATTMRDKADVLERMGEYDRAIATYRKAMGLMREGHWLHNELRNRVVDVYRKADRLPELIEEYEKKWRSPNYDESMTLAELYDELGREKEALEYFRRAIKLDRNEAEPRLAVIRMLERQGDDQKVVDAYEDLIRIAPRESRYQFELVRIYFRMGEQNKAEKLLERIGRRFRSDPNVYVTLADAYMRYDMREKALDAYKRLVRLDPRNESYIISLGEYYYRSGKLDKAVDTWEKLLDARLSEAEAHALLGETLAEHGMLDKGLRHYEKAVELAPDDTTIRRGLATNYVRARRWEKGIQAWRHIMNNSDEAEARGEARGRIISIYRQQNRLRAKMRDFEEDFSSDPPDVEAGFFLAEAHLKLNEFGEAEAVFQKLQSIESIGEKEQLEALHALLRIYNQTKDAEKAISVLQQLAELKPQLSREYYHRIAELSLDLYDDDQALRYAMRAVEINPDDATAHARLADVYRQMQKLEQAIKEYRIAIDLDPKAFRHRMELAELLLEQGEYKQADEQYRTVVKKADDETTILKAGRKALELAEANGRLAELETEFAPLSFKAPKKPVYRKILLELYDTMVTPIVNEIRYGVFEDEQAVAERRTQLQNLGQRALPVLTGALQTDDISQKALAIRLAGDLRLEPAALQLARTATEENNSLRTLAMISVARIGAERGAEPLIDALDHTDPDIRDLSTWALGFCGGVDAERALVDVLGGGQSWTQQALAAVSLGRIGSDRGARALNDSYERSQLGKYSNSLSVAVIWALGRAGADSSRGKLLQALENGSEEVRFVAAWSLAQVGGDGALKALLDAYWSPERDMREPGARGLVQMAAMHSVGAEQKADQLRRDDLANDLRFISDRSHKIGTGRLLQSLSEMAQRVDLPESKGFIADHQAEFTDALEKTLNTGDEDVQSFALRALADSSGEPAFRILEPMDARDRSAVKEMIGDVSSEVRALAAAEKPPRLRAPAVQLLGIIGSASDQPLVVGALDSTDEMVREAAAVALGHWNANRSIVDALMAKLDDDFFAVRVASARSLGALVEPEADKAAAVTEALIAMLDDDFKTVRAASANALAGVASQRALEVIDERIDEMDPAVKIAALRGLAHSESDAAKQILERYLDHRDVRFRRAARGEL